MHASRSFATMGAAQLACGHFRTWTQRVLRRFAAPGAGLGYRCGMTFKVGTLPLLLPRQFAAAANAAFDATGSHLVAGNRVFTANDAFFDLAEETEATNVFRSVAHPQEPVVAQLLRSGTLELVDLQTRQRTAVEGATARAAFSHSGHQLAVAAHGNGHIRLLDLKGKVTGTLEIPPELVGESAPSFVFSPDDKELIVFPALHTRLVVPLDGGKTSRLPTLAGVKAVPFSQCHCLSVGESTFLYDHNAWWLVRADGTVAWRGKGQHEAAAVVRGGAAIALIRQTKRSILFMDTATGEERATLKTRPIFSPVGFACSATLGAYAVAGGVELINLPPELETPAAAEKVKKKVKSKA